MTSRREKVCEAVHPWIAHDKLVNEAGREACDRVAALIESERAECARLAKSFDAMERRAIDSERERDEARREAARECAEIAARTEARVMVDDDVYETFTCVAAASAIRAHFGLEGE